jgi:hypothetical protein
MWNELFAYAAKSAIVLTLLYAPYTLLLRKEHFFRQNRLTLVGILVLSLTLPFINLQRRYIIMQPSLQSSAPVVMNVEAQPIEPISIDISEPTSQTPEPVAVSQPTRQPIDYMQWLCILYIIGVSVAVGIRFWQFLRMDRLIRRGCLWHDTVDGITIYCHANDIAPYSWMRRIVISQHDYDNHRHEILLHERGHVLCHHSWDILLLMIVQTVQWFNPFVYMFGASLRDVHEYEADDYVLRQGVSAGQYQTLLLKTAVGASAYSFANNFNHSKIKSRIVMMKHKKINPWMRCKVLYTLPIILISLCLFASPDKEQRVTIAKPKLEVIGKKTHFSYDGAYIYNPERNDSHLYAGYYYTAEQLDSIFGERTKTYYDEGWAAYVYEHEGVRIEMAPYTPAVVYPGLTPKAIPADSYGMYSFWLVGNKYKCRIEYAEIQVGDNINFINKWEFEIINEKVLFDGRVRIWYKTVSGDDVFITHKNDIITEIRYELDYT